MVAQAMESAWQSNRGNGGDGLEREGERRGCHNEIQCMHE